MIRFAVLLLAGAAALTSSAGADTPTLQATVGPGFTITLTDASGSPVTLLAPGSYTIHVNDQSDFHNFHLTGPGVDQATPVQGTGTADWNVTLADGTYTFLCDAHPTQMKGAFTVATQPLPPPVVNSLAGSVGPGRTISFVHSAPAGKAKITIRDRTAKDNFHLSGPGVEKKTGVAFKGTATWAVTLQAGTYTFRSDAHKALRGTLTVTG